MSKSYSHDSFLYGVVYYPEQWPESQWDVDLTRIAVSFNQPTFDLLEERELHGQAEVPPYGVRLIRL